MKETASLKCTMPASIPAAGAAFLLSCFVDCSSLSFSMDDFFGYPYGEH
jgi:hypothetical protein